MTNYEQLYQDQLKLNTELKEKIGTLTDLNSKLRNDVKHITTHIDEEVMKKMNLTKARINEMIAMIDRAIDYEQKSIPGLQRKQRQHR